MPDVLTRQLKAKCNTINAHNCYLHAQTQQICPSEKDNAARPTEQFLAVAFWLDSYKDYTKKKKLG